MRRNSLLFVGEGEALGCTCHFNYSSASVVARPVGFNPGRVAASAQGAQPRADGRRRGHRGIESAGIGGPELPSMTETLREMRRLGPWACVPGQRIFSGPNGGSVMSLWYQNSGVRRMKVPVPVASFVGVEVGQQLDDPDRLGL